MGGKGCLRYGEVSTGGGSVVKVADGSPGAGMGTRWREVQEPLQVLPDPWRRGGANLVVVDT